MDLSGSGDSVFIDDGPPPARAEGWVKVLERGVKFSNRGNINYFSSLRWRLQYCVLDFKSRKLHHFNNELEARSVQTNVGSHVLKMSRFNTEYYSMKWNHTYCPARHGVATLPAKKKADLSSTLPRKLPKYTAASCTYVNQDGVGRARRKSAPSGPIQMTTDASSPSSKLSGIFPKRMKIALKRTKSVGKFDKHGPLKEEDEGSEMTSPHSIKPTHSHESLLLGPQTSLDVFDLTANDLVIQPLHSSILGQDHCFQITTSVGKKYYSCRSASERDKWIESIRSAIHPEKDNKRRRDSVLRLWVVEGKNVPLKRKYYCEIYVDDVLYARTTAKSRGDMVFWGEQFLFTCLPDAKNLKIHLYKEPDKKKRRDKNYLGHVSISLEPISNRPTIEKWYPVTNSSSKGDTPSLRIKTRYQSINILPIAQYSELAQYLKENAVSLCQLIEQQINVKTKEEIATSLIKVLQCLGTANEFLVELVMTETRTVNDESLIFRANTMATKSMEAYMKLIGGKYIQDTLGDFIHTIYENDEDCEVDPTKVSSSVLLQQHQATLTMLCEMACCKIVNSTAAFPSDLRAVFHSFHQHSQNYPNGPEICDKLISGCIFLRFLCPAIMSPSLFDLIQEYPSDKTSRCLTLIAKTVQALANYTNRFGTKESYMVFMNEFLEREWSNMRTFLQEISSSHDRGSAVKFNGYTDLGKELSLLHSLLVETLDDCEKLSEDKIGPLKGILSRITSYASLPEGTIPYSSSSFIQMTKGSTNTTKVSTTSISTSPIGKKSLNKIFDDAKLSDSTDVEMLPPYNIAMERSITSSTVNNLVDFIQQDSPNSVVRRTGRSIAVFDIGNLHTDVRHVETSTTVEKVETTTEVEERIMEELEGDMVVSMKSETTKSVNQSFSVSLEKNVLSNPSTNRASQQVDRNGNGNGNGRAKRRNRTLPLSFQNPAYQLSKKSLRHMDIGASDSVSSSNSSPSNSDGASSNHDGDVSQNGSSCDGVSPPSNRRTAAAKETTTKIDIMAHTLPKAAHRSHNITTIDLYPKDKQMSESQSSGSIHSNKMNKPKFTSSCSSTSLFEPSRTPSTSNVTSPTEAIRAMNNAAKAAFFSSVMAPVKESTSPSSSSPTGAPYNSTSVQQRSQAVLHINNGSHLPSFAVTITNPKPESQTAQLGSTFPEPVSSSSPSISPPTSSPSSASSEDVPPTTLVRSEAVIQTGSPLSVPVASESTTFTTQRFTTSQTILPTPCRPKQLSTDSTSPSSRAPLMGTSNLEKNHTRYPATPVVPSTASVAFSITNLTPAITTMASPTSPSSLPLPRKKIMTQFASKPRAVCLSESSSSNGSLNKNTDATESAKDMLSIGKKTRSLSVQHNFTFKSSSSPPEPVWTRRVKDPSAIDRETQTEMYSLEIQLLKDELEKMSAQLEETQQRLDEEEKRADLAIAEMKVEVEESQLELRIQHDEKDKQIKDIITRLVTVEEELKKEQEEMVAVVSAKQKIIDAQEQRIQSLDEANVRLMRALDQLKERYQLTRRTKSSSDIRSTSKLTPLNGSLRSTNC